MASLTAIDVFTIFFDAAVLAFFIGLFFLLITMEFPTTNQLYTSLAAHLKRFVTSLGGWIYLFSVLLLLILANLINPLSRWLIGLNISKMGLWITILHRAFAKILKVSSTLWEELLTQCHEADKLYPVVTVRHQVVDDWLKYRGLLDDNWRKRLIQAAVLQLRLVEALEIWETLGTPRIVSPATLIK